MVVIDAEGTAVFWNEPFEKYTGLRFDETGRVPKEMWTKGLSAVDEDGVDIPTEALPPIVALEEHRPAFVKCAAYVFDIGPSNVVLSALPIKGQQGRFLGIVILFWRSEEFQAAEVTLT